MGLNEKFFKSAAGGITANEYFTPVLYTGNGGTQSISSLNFASGLVWIKTRSNVDSHFLWDTIRGANKMLITNSTSAELTRTGVTAFNSNGFSLGNYGGVNNSGYTYVAWCWKAGTNATNNEGNTQSIVSASVDSGFSIVQYSGAGILNPGHGLDSAPNLIITKGQSATEDWYIYNSENGTGKYLSWTRNDDGGGVGNDAINSNANTFSAVTNTTFTHSVTSASLTYVAYCFHNVDGYQKIGTYTGGGSNLTVINVGFAPTMVLIKCTSNAGTTWRIFDTVRGTDKSITVNSSIAEYDDAQNYVDFTSTGFEFNRSVTQSNSDINGSGRTYIYLAIA
tara:strand:- start:21 stop:1031 length:1011 start_codon:yes stop_codon:yes gene_type:complete